VVSNYRGIDFAALFPFSEEKWFQLQNVGEYGEENEFWLWVRTADPVRPAGY